MLIENNTLKRIDNFDIIDGVFTAPDNVLHVGFGLDCNNVVKMFLPNVLTIGETFLYSNNTLEHLEIPNVKIIGNNFLCKNKTLNELIIPNIWNIGDNFLYYNRSINRLSIPNVKIIGRNFLYKNVRLESLDIPNIMNIGINFLFNNCKFKYNSKIIKSLNGNLFIGCKKVDKKEYIRRLNIKKLLC